MSIRALNWTWQQKLSPTKKIILMALADSANHRDECWPGIPFIARRCCVSKRTVQRVFQQFEDTGLLVISRRFTPAGRQTSNGYRLNITNTPSHDNLSPAFQAVDAGSENLSDPGATFDGTVEGDMVAAPLEPPEQSEQQLHYPRQLSEAERKAASEMLGNINITDAQTLLDELADAVECSTIKTTTLRWFRALVSRHETGIFRPAGGIRIAERRKEQQRALMKKKSACEPSLKDPEAARDALMHLKKLIKNWKK